MNGLATARKDVLTDRVVVNVGPDTRVERSLLNLNLNSVTCQFQLSTAGAERGKEQVLGLARERNTGGSQESSGSWPLRVPAAFSTAQPLTYASRVLWAGLLVYFRT